MDRYYPTSCTPPGTHTHGPAVSHLAHNKRTLEHMACSTSFQYNNSIASNAGAGLQGRYRRLQYSHRPPGPVHSSLSHRSSPSYCHIPQSEPIIPNTDTALHEQHQHPHKQVLGHLQSPPAPAPSQVPIQRADARGPKAYQKGEHETYPANTSAISAGSPSSGQGWRTCNCGGMPFNDGSINHGCDAPAQDTHRNIAIDNDHVAEMVVQEEASRCLGFFGFLRFLCFLRRSTFDQQRLETRIRNSEAQGRWSRRERWYNPRRTWVSGASPDTSLPREAGIAVQDPQLPSTGPYREHQAKDMVAHVSPGSHRRQREPQTPTGTAQSMATVQGADVVTIAGGHFHSGDVRNFRDIYITLQPHCQHQYRSIDQIIADFEVQRVWHSCGGRGGGISEFEPQARRGGESDRGRWRSVDGVLKERVGDRLPTRRFTS